MTADLEDIIKDVLGKELEALRYGIDLFDMEELAKQRRNKRGL
jgi:hypothetical protein